MKALYALALGLLLTPMMAWAQTNSGETSGEDADAARFKDILARHARGENVTPEEQQFAKAYSTQHNLTAKSPAKAKGGQPAKAAKERPSSKPANASAPASAPQQGEWEQFSDGSTGRIMDFAGAGGVTIAGYQRKPAGDGPFPVVVAVHGGGHFPQATYGMGRSMRHPTVDFVAAGWAVYAIDFRASVNPVPGVPDIDPIQWDDAILAIAKARAFPFVDPKRVAVVGGSHGGLMFSRVASRVDVTCGVLCAPAILDLCEIAKAVANGGAKTPGSVMNLVHNLEAETGATVDEIEKDPDRYGYSSALTEAAKVRFPLLIINGRNDAACPCSVAEIYVQKLRDAGKEVDTYLPDNGPHGFYFGSPQETPETPVAAQRMVEFIRRHFGE